MTNIWDAFETWLRACSSFEAFGLALAASLFALIFSFIVYLVFARLPGHRVIPLSSSIRKYDLLCTAGAFFMNSFVAWIGWSLWQYNVIVFEEKSILLQVLDLVIMLGYMDFTMYLTHRMAHLKLPYQWVHEIHHRHDDVSLLSLFVLHPLEVFGFGLLITGFATVSYTHLRAHETLR